MNESLIDLNWSAAWEMEDRKPPINNYVKIHGISFIEV